MPEPDISVVRGRSRDYINQPGAGDVALIVEVADKGRLAFDRGEKLGSYAGGGIPVYWIINLVDRQVEVYTDPGPGGYQSREDLQARPAHPGRHRRSSGSARSRSTKCCRDVGPGRGPSMSRTRKKPAAGTQAFGDWILTPEGAAIHPGERTAVIADVHLGYEWARGAAGDCVPAHSLVETLARISAVLARAAIARLVVAGDLVESARPCRRTAADVRGLHDWLESRGVTLLALEGNHDRGRIRLGRAANPGAAPSSSPAPGSPACPRAAPSTAGRSSTAIGRSSPSGRSRATTTRSSGSRGSPRPASSPGRAGSSCRPSRPMPPAATS